MKQFVMVGDSILRVNTIKSAEKIRVKDYRHCRDVFYPAIRVVCDDHTVTQCFECIFDRDAAFEKLFIDIKQ